MWLGYPVDLMFLDTYNRFRSAHNVYIAAFLHLILFTDAYTPWNHPEIFGVPFALTPFIGSIVVTET